MKVPITPTTSKTAGHRRTLVLLTGSITSLGSLGTLHIKARRRRECGQAWVDFTKQTSLMPFVHEFIIGASVLPQ